MKTRSDDDEFPHKMLNQASLLLLLLLFEEYLQISHLGVVDIVL